MSPEIELRQLNEAYVRAALDGDVEWHRNHLAEDFVCIDSDGSVLDKAAFLRQTAQEPELASYHLDEVHIRVYGEVALIRAQGSWKARNGTPGISCYTDVYVRSNDRWLAVSAQITRPVAVTVP